MRQTGKRVAASRVLRHLASEHPNPVRQPLPFCNIPRKKKKRNPVAWPSACPMIHGSFSASDCAYDAACGRQCYHIWPTPPQRIAFMAKEHWRAPYSLLRPSSSRSKITQQISVTRTQIKTQISKRAKQNTGCVRQRLQVCISEHDGKRFYLDVCLGFFTRSMDRIHRDMSDGSHMD